MNVENDTLLLNEIKKKLTANEWDILLFSVIPNILIDDMLFFRFQKTMEISIIKNAIDKLIKLGIFTAQSNPNCDRLFIIHDRIKKMVYNLQTFDFKKSCEELINYYENYNQKEIVFYKQLYNDKLLCQLILGNNNEWRCCYQATMENGEEFECQKLLYIYEGSFRINNNDLKLWYQYYKIQNEFIHTRKLSNVDIILKFSCNADRELTVYCENIIGVYFFNQSKYNDALYHFERASAIAKNNNEKIAVQYNICQTLFHKQQYVQSLNLLMDIYANMPNAMDDLFTAVKLKLFQAVLDTKLYNLEQAVSHFDESMTLVKEQQQQLKAYIPLHHNHKPPRPIYIDLNKDIYNYMGDVYLTKGDFIHSINYHKIGLACKEAYDDIYGMAWAHNDLGKVYYLSGDTQKAKKHLEKSCYLFRQSNDKLCESYPLLELSYVHQYNGDTKSAIKFLEESLRLFRKKKDNNNILMVLNHLGRLYQSQGFLNLAEKIFNYCLHNLDKNTFTKQKSGWIYNNLARNFLYKSDYENALFFFNKAFYIFEEIYEKRGISYVINNMAEVKAKQLKYGEAYQLFMKSCLAKEDMGDKHAICYTYRELAELNIKLDQFNDAQFYAHKALDLCNKGNFIMLKGDILKTWGNYYAQKQEYEKAWEFYMNALHNFEDQFFYSRILTCIEKINQLPYEQKITSGILPNKEVVLNQMNSEEEKISKKESQLLDILY